MVTAWVACSDDVSTSGTAENNAPATQTPPTPGSGETSASPITTSTTTTTITDVKSVATNTTDNPPVPDGIYETVTVMDSVSGQIIKTQRPINAISASIGPNPITKTDPVKPVLVKPAPATPQESKIVRVLTSNYWVIWALIRINDKPANRINQGTWFKFNDDGTYTYGFWEKKIGSGTWTFDGKKATLQLDSELYGDDREWSFKIGKDEDVMIWVGTPRYRTTAINLKLQNFLFIPKNRKEIGLPE
jgi:hypothetical protein